MMLRLMEEEVIAKSIRSSAAEDEKPPNEKELAEMAPVAIACSTTFD